MGCGDKLLRLLCAKAGRIAFIVTNKSLPAPLCGRASVTVRVLQKCTQSFTDILSEATVHNEVARWENLG